jgi:hypothetical protein
MVNFNDPAVLASDAGAHPFLVALCNVGKPLSFPFFSGDGQAVAHRRRSLYVSMERSSLYLLQYNPQLNR